MKKRRHLVRLAIHAAEIAVIDLIVKLIVTAWLL